MRMTTGARASASRKPAPTSRTLRTLAVLDGDDYVLNGQKIWISTAHIAKWGLFLVRTDPTAIETRREHEGITALIVDMEADGIECRPIRDITGEDMFNEVFFTTHACRRSTDSVTKGPAGKSRWAPSDASASARRGSPSR